MPTSSDKSLLLIGASRGLGYALAEEYLKRGWHLVATERGSSRASCTILRLPPAQGVRYHHAHEFFRRNIGNRFPVVILDADIDEQQVESSRCQTRAQRGDLIRMGDVDGLDLQPPVFMRSFAARHRDDPRTLLVLAPGWVRTDMGGAEARLSIEESIPNPVKTIAAQDRKGGLQYLDCLGRTVPW